MWQKIKCWLGCICFVLFFSFIGMFLHNLWVGEHQKAIMNGLMSIVLFNSVFEDDWDD